MFNHSTVRYWAVSLTVIWLVLVTVFFLTWSGQGTDNLSHPFNLRLSEVGDYVAGSVAPLAVGWLVVTVYLQAASIAESRDTFAEAQAATFRLELFDKRLQVLQKLKLGVFLLNLGDEQERKGRIELAAAAEMAEFLLGEDDRQFVIDLLRKAERLGYCDRMYTVLQPKERTEAEERLLQELVDEGYELRLWFITKVTEVALHEMFRPYLDMPAPASGRKILED